MMTLIALAISVAFFYSAAVVLGLEGRLFFWELATLIDVLLLGHWIEMRSVMGASRAVESLARLMPSEALWVHENGETETVSVQNLSSGDRVRIKPGEHIPADGRILEGETSVNESMISGESTPVYKTRDDRVVGGSINGEGSLDIEVEKTGDDSFLSQVIRMVEEAQQSKSQPQTLADRAAFWLTRDIFLFDVIINSVRSSDRTPRYNSLKINSLSFLSKIVFCNQKMITTE